MKLLAVLALFVGLIAVYSSHFPDENVRRDNYRQALALNYATFRNAVFSHVFAEDNVNKRPGDLSASMLEPLLPFGWKPLRDWQARIFTVEGNLRCAIWGEASSEEIEQVRRALNRDSFAAGRAEGGKLLPGHGAVVPVPSFVPEGSLVSILDLD
ncbi:MAG: type IV pilus biogenesis protein PilM [Bilophila sp.]